MQIYLFKLLTSTRLLRYNYKLNRLIIQPASFPLSRFFLTSSSEFSFSYLKIMDKLKSLKNYINQAATSAASATSPTTPNSNQIEDETPKSVQDASQTKTINARLHKSLNDSTKRITNLLQFRSLSAKSNEPQTQTKRPGSANRPKFLRSSSTSFNLKTKTTNGKKQFESFDLKTPNEIEDFDVHHLFLQINSSLEDLIKHFDQLCAENTQSNINNFNFMETTDQSAHTYLKLTTHAKYLMIRCVDLYKKIELNVHKYDFDPKLKANGYRSMLKVFESCACRLSVAINDLNERKNKFYFQLKLNNSNLPASFLNANVIKDLQTWLKVMEKLEILLQTGLQMQIQTLNDFENKIDSENINSVIRMKQFHDGPSLFVHLNQIKDRSIENNLFSLASTHQEAFFGRACGFQFCDSLQLPLTGCAIALASYNDGFEAYSNKENTLQQTQLTSSLNSPSNQQLKRVSSVNSASQTPTSTFSNTIGKAAMSVYSGTKYMMDPDSRAKKMSQIMRKANVEFCKAFWQLTETSIVQMGSNLITPTLAVNVVKRISLTSTLRLPRVKSDQSSSMSQETIENDFVDIKPPTGVLPNDTIKIRILSNEMLQGMQDLDKLQTIESPVAFANQNQPSLASYNTNLNSNLSKNLILHVHGGGFIAHSSKSHEIYLKPWCKELKVPIVSIDYSLAPEHAFPRASEECFYVYAWCLLNKNLLGWTGERIICVGDSAGGVLVTNIVQRAINNEVRVPDALVPIYAPFLLAYSISPSRILSVMDPLLNLGILWRCLAAYSGIDFKVETEKYKQRLNIDDSSNLKNSKSSNNEFTIRYSRSEMFDSNNEAKVSSNNEKVIFDNGNELDEIDESNDEFNIGPIDDSSSYKFKHFSDDELLMYYEMLDDSIFLIDKLRNHKVTHDQYMSPILSSDSVISKFPKTCLIACNDPFLDDNIEMLKRFKKLNVNCEILFVDNGSPHGFLNMQTLVTETHEAHLEALEFIKETFSELEEEASSKENFQQD